MTPRRLRYLFSECVLVIGLLYLCSGLLRAQSQDYINARYDSIVERVEREDAEREKNRKAFEDRFNPRKDAAIPDSTKKRDEMVERQKTKWKNNPADNATTK